MQPILNGTKHQASSMQLQIGCTGPISATTKCRTQGDWNRKIIQDMHYKKLYTWSWKNSWKSEMLTWMFPKTFCSWVWSIQIRTNILFSKHFVVVVAWIWLEQMWTPCSCQKTFCSFMICLFPYTCHARSLFFHLFSPLLSLRILLNVGCFN